VLFCAFNFELQVIWSVGSNHHPFSPTSHIFQFFVTNSEEAPAEGEEYVNMFYIDAAENNGVIYLFGKLPVQEPVSAGAAGSAGVKGSDGECALLFFAYVTFLYLLWALMYL